MTPEILTYWLRCGIRLKHLHASLDTLEDGDCADAGATPGAGMSLGSSPTGDPRRLAFAAARTFVGSEGTTFLIVCGPHGTGKSHLAAAILKHFRSGVFATSPELLQLLRSLPFDDTSERPSKGRFIETLKTCPLLVLDELGTSMGGVDENQLLDDVLSFRHDRSLPTVLISNADAATLGRFLGERISDRIAESLTEIRLTGASRRDSTHARVPSPSTAHFTGTLPVCPEELKPEPAEWAPWFATHYPDKPPMSYRAAPEYLREEFRPQHTGH